MNSTWDSLWVGANALLTLVRKDGLNVLEDRRGGLVLDDEDALFNNRTHNSRTTTE